MYAVVEEEEELLAFFPCPPPPPPAAPEVVRERFAVLFPALPPPLPPAPMPLLPPFLAEEDEGLLLFPLDEELLFWRCWREALRLIVDVGGGKREIGFILATSPGGSF